MTAGMKICQNFEGKSSWWSLMIYLLMIDEKRLFFLKIIEINLFWMINSFSCFRCIRFRRILLQIIKCFQIAHHWIVHSGVDSSMASCFYHNDKLWSNNVANANVNLYSMKISPKFKRKPKWLILWNIYHLIGMVEFFGFGCVSLRKVLK